MIHHHQPRLNRLQSQFSLSFIRLLSLRKKTVNHLELRSFPGSVNHNNLDIESENSLGPLRSKSVVRTHITSGDETGVNDDRIHLRHDVEQHWSQISNGAGSKNGFHFHEF